MICVRCPATAGPQDRFCGNCGWPLRQPSPYGSDANELPVVRWKDAPARDSMGRALAYERTEPESGRAFIPGESATGRDKIPDFPNGKGLGGRRSGEIPAGQGRLTGCFIECGSLTGAGFGAGRLVWADGAALYAWDLRSEKPVRIDLGVHRPVGTEAVLASGWRTYLATTQGWSVHHGLAGRVELLSPSLPTAVAALPQGAVAAFGTTSARYLPDGPQPLPELPFPASGLATDEGVLAAFGPSGEIAVLDNDAWRKVHSGVAASKFRQGWIVNGRAGALVAVDGQSMVIYQPLAGMPPADPLAVDSDTDVGVVPGRDGWDGHRVLAFVGGASPRVTVYSPSGSPPPAPRPLDTSVLGTTMTVVRRDAEGRGAITVAYVEPSGAGRLRFEPAREGSVPLPLPRALAANANDVRLFPTAEGLAMLAHDGTQAVLNLIPYP